MRIGRNNIAFNATRSKLIRNRRAKIKSGSKNSVWSSQSTNKSSITKTLLAQKKALAEKSSGKGTTAPPSETLLEETKKKYTSMETAAENTGKHLQKLLNTGEASLWGNSEKEVKPDTEKIAEEIENFVKAYNDMVQSLEETGGTISTMYQKQMHNYIVSDKSRLEQIGITENAKGKLEIDKEKLKAADTDKLKELFWGEGSFADKIQEKCEKVEENAETNLHSLNSATYSSLLSSYRNSGSRFDSEA